MILWMDAFQIGRASRRGRVEDRWVDFGWRPIMKKKKNSTVVWEPGAYELPLAAVEWSKTAKYEAGIGLGSVIPGGTAHYDYGACGGSIGRVHYSHDNSSPLAICFLTTEIT
ncbi:hypothetical protein E2K69_00410 [Escherichia coli]|nr:hypothetical protein E2K69_00410 [Escherichia coli]